MRDVRIAVLIHIREYIQEISETLKETAQAEVQAYLSIIFFFCRLLFFAVPSFHLNLDKFDKSDRRCKERSGYRFQFWIPGYLDGL